MKHICVDARLFGDHGIGNFLKGTLPFLAKEPSINLTLLHFPKDVNLLGPLCSNSVLMKKNVFSIKEQLELARKITRCDLIHILAVTR